MRDLTHIKQIKGEIGKVPWKETVIIIRWEEYFEKLLNDENERLIIGDRRPNFEVVTEAMEEVKEDDEWQSCWTRRHTCVGMAGSG